MLDNCWTVVGLLLASRPTMLDCSPTLLDYSPTLLAYCPTTGQQLSNNCPTCCPVVVLMLSCCCPDVVVYSVAAPPPTRRPPVPHYSPPSLRSSLLPPLLLLPLLSFSSLSASSASLPCSHDRSRVACPSVAPVPRGHFHPVFISFHSSLFPTSLSGGRFVFGHRVSSGHAGWHVAFAETTSPPDFRL